MSASPDASIAGGDIELASARVARREWQPIDTAPKTYSPPLSHYNHHAPQILGLYGRAWYCVCSWGGPSNPCWIGGDNKPVPFQPTRWMPLPPAEATADEQAAALKKFTVPLAMFVKRIQANGEWDDGCFYYRGTSASELEEPLRLAHDAFVGKLADATKEPPSTNEAPR